MMSFKSQQNAPVITSTGELQGWLNSVERPLVFTNGCFDILHRGHVSYLQQAAAFGSSLLVALNTDDSVRRQGKGEDRPLNQLEDRMAVIAALGCVDAVCSFASDTPLELITNCRPDILVKGGDWPIESIVGCKEVLAWGGQCYSIPFEFERSTTTLLNKIRQLPS
jgi:rfaE bifunctional protein nucleotidyltransferase chain/domain